MPNSTKSNIDFSVIIISHNTRALLADCLESVFSAKTAGSREVIVVDNASRDDTLAMLASNFPAARLICNAQNLGFAAANNQALREARGQYFLMLNSDAAVLPDAFLHLSTAFAEHNELGIVGLQLLNPDGTMQPSWGAFPTPADELRFQTFLYKVWPTRFPYGRRVHPLQRPQYERFQWVDWVTGAACALRREVYARIGGMPEDSHMYGEDLEYCWRATAAGYRVGYYPSARAYHRLQGTARQDYGRWIENYTRAMLAYYQRHCSPGAYQRAARYIWAGSLARQGLWRILGLLMPGRRPEARGRVAGYRRAARIAADVFRAPREKVASSK